MVGPDGVNLLDIVRECRRLVYQELQELMRRRLSGEKAKLQVDRASPGENHAGRNLQRRSSVSKCTRAAGARSGCGARCGNTRCSQGYAR